MHLTIVSRLTIALFGALGALGAGFSAAESLTVVSWGGSYARACQEAYLKPFATETGIRVRLEDYNGGLSQVRAQVEAGNVHWDIVDLEYADLVRGCDEGLFEILDASMLADGADGSAPADDYYPDMISECGAGMLFYSTVFAYNHARTTGEVPATIQDFFDLERFPGPPGHAPFAAREPRIRPDGRRRSSRRGLRRIGHPGRRRTRVQKARHHQEPRGVVGGRSTAATDAR